MSTPQFTTIVNAIVSGLAGMTVVGGYNYAPAGADDEFFFPDELAALAASKPYYLVIDGEETFEDQMAGKCRAEHLFYVFGYVRDETTPRQTCRKARQDVLKWFRANETAGSCELARVRRMVMGDVFSPLGFSVEIKKPYAAFRADIECGYLFDLSSGG